MRRYSIPVFLSLTPIGDMLTALERTSAEYAFNCMSGVNYQIARELRVRLDRLDEFHRHVTGVTKDLTPDPRRTVGMYTVLCEHYLALPPYIRADIERYLPQLNPA